MFALPVAVVTPSPPACYRPSSVSSNTSVCLSCASPCRLQPVHVTNDYQCIARGKPGNMICFTQRFATVAPASKAAPACSRHVVGSLRRSVKTRGTGKELEIAGVVFQPFQREHLGTTRVCRRTGTLPSGLMASPYMCTLLKSSIWDRQRLRSASVISRSC